MADGDLITMKLIPSIDIIEGQCVRLYKGDYNAKKVYDGSPLDIAKSFEDVGVEYLHIIDLDGARQKTIVNSKIVSTIAQQTNLKIDFGGGITSDDDVKKAFDCGVNQVISGSVAAKNPDLFLSWVEQYGPEKMILAADARNGKIAIDAWQNDSSLQVIEFIHDFVGKGVKHVICTDIGKDGTLEGCALDLYIDLMKNQDFELIASGGVSDIEDIRQLEKIGCPAVIFGRAFYEGKITLSEIKKIVNN